MLCEIVPYMTGYGRASSGHFPLTRRLAAAGADPHGKVRRSAVRFGPHAFPS